MKLFKRTFKSLLLGAIAFIAPAVVGLSSCDSVIYDDLEACPEGVRLRFVYDYNMEFANAFPSQVHCLTVMVYNEDGSFREKLSVTDPALLSNENWRMDIDLPEGKYKLLVYGGMECADASYHFVQTPTQGSQLTSMQVALNQDIMDRSIGTELHSLFYGYDKASDGALFTPFEVEVKKSTMAYDEYTVYLMKDTNNLRIVLQELNGDPVDDKDFNFEVVDDNTLMGWNNDVISTSPFSYQPWTRGSTSVGLLPDGTDSKVAFAEFSFGRLMTSNSPILHVTRRSDGSDVINIPLINYLLLLKSESFHKMPNQEFLDRESQWSMIFFLDRHWKWISVKIEISDWVVRINNPELQ